MQPKTIQEIVYELDKITDDLTRMDGCLENGHCRGLIMALRQVIKELDVFAYEGGEKWIRKQN